MGNRRLIITFALIFAAVFSLFYYALFQLFAQGSEEASRTLYLNQVGIFEEEENAQKVCDRLTAQKLSPYQVEKEGAFVVVTSIYDNEEATEAEAKTLEEMELSYLTKKITVEGSDLVKAVDAGDYEKVLQAVEDEASGA